jgi:phosphatidylserine/phosphatidylglycerophosphate/cardiolipin synthase-like enzyme
LLESEGISLQYIKHVHAKIIIADKEIAIISSMNFYANSTAGATWEAGVVSTEPKMIEEISNSVNNMLRNVA